MKLAPSHLALQYAQLGVELLHQEKFDDAIDAFRLVLGKMPGDAEALCNLGIALMKRESWREAEEVTRRYVDLAPDDVAACVRLGILRRRLEMTESSMETLRKATRLAPDLAVAHKELGASCLKGGRLEEATKAFQRALELKKVYVDAWCGLAKSHELQQKPGLALSVFLDSLQQLPSEKRGPVYARLGRIYRKIGQWKHARVALEKAIAKGEKDPQLAFELGYVLGKLGNTREARAQVEILESKSPELARALRTKIAEAEARPVDKGKAVKRIAEDAERGVAAKLLSVFRNIVHAAAGGGAPIRNPDLEETDGGSLDYTKVSSIGIADELGLLIDDPLDGSVADSAPPLAGVVKAKVIELNPPAVRQAQAQANQFQL